MTENCKFRKAILSAFYNISQRNFGILLILWCSFKLWWNFCLGQLRLKFWKSGNRFPLVIQNDWKLQTSQGYIIRILQHFATKLWNITNFVMLFHAVMEFCLDLLRSKFWLIWDWSIHKENTKEIMSVKEFAYLIQNHADLHKL
jgi:hypothetical protein